jgi:multidrug transporter EmrE-like cation transporter
MHPGGSPVPDLGIGLFHFLEVNMPEWVQTSVLLATSAAFSTLGAALQRYAVASGDMVMAVLGCLCWGATAGVFLALLRHGHELAVASVLTSVFGILSVQLIGWLWFQETLSVSQIAAIGLMIIGMVLLSWPRTI